MEFAEYLDRFSTAISPVVVEVGDGFTMTLATNIGILKSMKSGRAAIAVVSDAVWTGYHAGAYALAGPNPGVEALLGQTVDPTHRDLIESEVIHVFNTTGFTVPPLATADDVAPYVTLMRAVALRSRAALATFSERASDTLNEKKAGQYVEKVQQVIPPAFMAGTTLAMIAVNLLANSAGITEPQDPQDPPSSSDGAAAESD